MYFLSLESLKSRMENFSPIKKEIYIDAIEKLDSWLISMSPAKKRKINSNEFSDLFGINRLLGLEIFDEAQKLGTFSLYFEVRSEDGMEILFRGNKLEQIKGQSKLYSEINDEEVSFDETMIEVYFKLIDSPRNVLGDEWEITEKKVESPSCSIENAEDALMKERLQKIFDRS